MDYLLNEETDTEESLNYRVEVLNLIINGLPSKQTVRVLDIERRDFSFKPYYKWTTF